MAWLNIPGTPEIVMRHVIQTSREPWDMPGSYNRVVLYNGRVVAVMLCQIEHKKNRLHIKYISADPDYEQHGLEMILLSAAQFFCREQQLSSMWAFCLETSAREKRMYESFGFTLKKFVPLFEDENIHAMLYEFYFPVKKRDAWKRMESKIHNK
jgi:ribosomal protein S18 acetylase RimI-like enzyme